MIVRMLTCLTLSPVGCGTLPGGPHAAGPAPQPDPPPGGVTGTFSIVAIDPVAGTCGAAVASRYPAVGGVVPFARAGVGAFCTQHWHNPPWGPRALDLLANGEPPERVFAELLKDDKNAGKRQLAIIDMKGRALNRNPDDADPGGWWWGSAAGRNYACQGNTLAGPEVVAAMARAFEQTAGEGGDGKAVGVTLADRLVAALVAGDCAGGDHRGRLAAAVVVAKPGVDGNWLDLRVDKHDDAVIELAKRYADLDHAAKGTWPGGRPPFKHPCPGRPAATRPADPTSRP